MYGETFNYPQNTHDKCVTLMINELNRRIAYTPNSNHRKIVAECPYNVFL